MTGKAGALGGNPSKGEIVLLASDFMTFKTELQHFPSNFMCLKQGLDVKHAKTNRLSSPKCFYLLSATQ